MNIQKDCELVDRVIKRDIRLNFLTPSEAQALNNILLFLTIDGKYNEECDSK